MQRGIAYRRMVRNKHIQRKRRIIVGIVGTEWYSHLGQYSKGKIHCSCGSCTFGKKYNRPTHKDYMDREIVKSQLNDLYQL